MKKLRERLARFSSAAPTLRCQLLVMLHELQPICNLLHAKLKCENALYCFQR